MKPCRTIPILILLSLINFLPVTGQDTTKDARNQTKLTAPAAIPLTEIPGSREQLNNRLQQTSDILKNIPEIDEIHRKLEELKLATKDLTNIGDEKKLRNMSNRERKDLLQRAELFRSQLTSWQSSLESRIQSLQTEKEELEKTREIWELTEKSAREEKAPQSVIQNIGTNIKSVKKASQDIKSVLDKLLSLQNQLSGEEILLTDLGTNIGRIEAQARKEIFKLDSSPIWQTLTEDQDQVPSLGDSFHNFLKFHRDNLIEFYKSYFETLFIHAVLMILIVVLMVSTRRFKQGMYDRADFTEKMHIILRYDLLALFFITLVFTKLIYFNAPIIIYSIAEIMMLVCITILLPRIEPLITNRMLVFFTVVFILEQIFSLTLKETLLQRFLILTTAILLLLFLIYQIQNKVFESSGWPSFVKYFRRIMIIIMILGLLSNLIGMVYLSEIITFGCVNIVFITLVILTTATILQVVFRLLIQSGPAQNLFIIQHHSVLIQKKWERFINFTAWVTWIYLSLNYLYIQEPVTEWMVNAITNRWTIGSIDISISDVLLFIFTIWFSIWISRFIRFILEGDVLPRFSLPRGVPAAISILTNYAIVGFGFFLAMSASGIDMTKFALLAGALGVGIGFGLQNIVNNFISGLILIFERPIQIGDVVDVSGITGKVKRIGIRSSTIRTFTGSEVIVPNANLISNEVINWTLSDKLRRIEIKVGVEYGTDPKRVLDMLNQIAVGHDKILKDPEPFVLFLGFGDSSLDFELRFWTANFETWMSLRTEISVSIYEAFEKAGITIPFPQRDLHIKNHGDLISRQKSFAGTPKSEESSDVVSKK